MLRTLVRDKSTLVAEASDWLRRMQKSLDQMNVRVLTMGAAAWSALSRIRCTFRLRLWPAVSDIDGVTGMAIIRAIVGGERDARRLAQLRHGRCHKSEEEIVQQLSGHWREDHLFSLKQALKMYDSIQERIGEYEREILRSLDHWRSRMDDLILDKLTIAAADRVKGMEREENRGQEAPKLSNLNKGRKILALGDEPMRQALYRISGVDLAQIDAIGLETIQVVMSEYGPDLSRFPTEKQFTSHVTLVPNRPVSGGKPVKKKKRRGSASTRVAAALRMAALSLRHSQTALGAYYRQIARRIGGDVAVFATARKLATLIYRLLRWGQPYVDQGAQAYEKHYLERRIVSLKARADQLGFELTPKTAIA
jgi:transposase